MTTWAEIHLASEVLAARLSRLVGSGDRVALSMHSTERWVVAATAVNRLGATIAGISPVVTDAERRSMLEVLEPGLVVADGDLLGGVPLRTEVVEFSERGLETAGGPDAELAPPVRAHDDSEFAVCFTSGTTGAPKAARFTTGAARAVMEIDSAGRPRTPAGRPGPAVISSTQFAHVGFVLKLAGHAAMGSAIHVMDRWSASEVIRLVERHRVAALGVVAPQLAIMLRSPAMEGADLSSLRMVIAGGAASPEALVDEARRTLGVAYSIRWSSTESGGVGLAALVDDDNPDAVGTIGWPRDGVEARLGDPVDGVGELQVRSAAMMAGYLGDESATERAFTPDGWLRTGDLARVRADGRFVLCGRGSDMYVRGGYNVHPAEVEEVLGTHRSVGDVAVVPLEDEVMGQIGVAVVVASDDRPPTLEGLREHAAGKLSAHKLPERLVLVDELPSTRAGKLDRTALGASVADRLGSDGERVT